MKHKDIIFNYGTVVMVFIIKKLNKDIRAGGREIYKKNPQVYKMRCGFSLFDEVYMLCYLIIFYLTRCVRCPYPSFSISSFGINLKDALLIQYLMPPLSFGPSLKR